MSAKVGTELSSKTPGRLCSMASWASNALFRKVISLPCINTAFTTQHFCHFSHIPLEHRPPFSLWTLATGTNLVSSLEAGGTVLCVRKQCCCLRPFLLTGQNALFSPLGSLPRPATGGLTQQSQEFSQVTWPN